MGAPITMAPAVTYMLPTIMGRIPNSCCVGFHFVPNINLRGPISAIAGTPLAKRKMQIAATAATEHNAQSRKTTFIIFSFALFKGSQPFLNITDGVF